jgi:hypothetical protein
MRFIIAVGLKSSAVQKTHSTTVSIIIGSTPFVTVSLPLIMKNKAKAITIKCREYKKKSIKDRNKTSNISTSPALNSRFRSS